MTRELPVRVMGLPDDHTLEMCEKRGCHRVGEEYMLDWGFHFDEYGYCLGCGGCGDPDCCGPCDCRFDR